MTGPAGGGPWPDPVWVVQYARAAVGGTAHAVTASSWVALGIALGAERAAARCGAALDRDALWWRAHPDMLGDPAWRRCAACAGP